MFKEDFDSYVCVGDTIHCEVDGIDFYAQLEFDYDTRPTDFDCYPKKAIERWHSNDWFFGGIILYAQMGDFVLNHIASLWGIECNFSHNNSYLLEIANELLLENLDTVKQMAREAFGALI